MAGESQGWGRMVDATTTVAFVPSVLGAVRGLEAQRLRIRAQD